MLKNYFKVAWRTIVRNKVYSGINILGLAAGMAVTLIIGLWVYQEYSYDKFLPDYKQLYQVRRNYDSNGDTLNFKTVSLKLADELRSQVPEIEYLAESDWMGEHGIAVGDTRLYINGGHVGSDFLKLFQFKFKEGNRNSALEDAYSIVLTESTAKSLFGNEDPMNKLVRIHNKYDLKVTGVLEDLPATSSIQFKFLVPFSFLEQTNPSIARRRTGSFAQNGSQIFLKLRKQADVAKVAAQIRTIEHSEKGNLNAMNSYVVLQPLGNFHLYNNYVNGKESAGFLEYVRLFTIVGILVLLIACINFVNLTTARSEKRAREVGIRKAVGSERQQLIAQFLIESFLLVGISFIVCLLIVQITLPFFNTLTGSTIGIPLTNPAFWAIVMAAVGITALLAGSRPAFYLSSFKPVKVLKGSLVTGKSGNSSRKALVVLQFACSVSLIISTIVIYRQVQHARNRPTGMEFSQLVSTFSHEDLVRNFDVIRNELKQKNIITGMTMSTSPATDVWWHSDIEQYPGKQAGETIEMGIIFTRDDYFKTLGMTMKEGRDFKGVNDTLSAVFNEAAIAQMKLKDPIGQVITFQGTQLTITGVVRDALMLSPFQSADPTMFLTSPSDGGVILYRLNPSLPTAKAIEELTSVFNKYGPGYPFVYEFVDASYDAKFKLEVLVGKLAGVFAALAIIISCLGLFGLVAYVAERRTKEIALRKVLGATVAQVWMMLSKDFVVLVLIGCAIATPLASYFLQNWLSKYPYRISPGVGVFVIAAGMAVVLTLVTISFQAIRAALANPVKSLRNE